MVSLVSKIQIRIIIQGLKQMHCSTLLCAVYAKEGWWREFGEGVTQSVGWCLVSLDPRAR